MQELGWKLRKMQKSVCVPLFPHLGLDPAFLGARAGLSLEGPDSRQRWNSPREGPVPPEDKVAVEGPPGPPAGDHPSSAGLGSARFSGTGVSEGPGTRGAAKGQPQRERSPEWVQALLKNLMSERQRRQKMTRVFWSQSRSLAPA